MMKNYTVVKREDTGVVLDFLPNGHPFMERRQPVAQVLGEQYFTLLEVVPKEGIFLTPNEIVYLGPDKRDKVHHIIGKIGTEQLTQTAKSELPFIIEDIVNKNEKKYVDFFNNASPVSSRYHEIELLPGIGKKNMWKILDERKIKPFESFEDIKKRVELLPDPKKSIIKRIILEIEGEDKYKVFIK
ncbi:MAG: DUF655 domain-containing protein [Candidatus Nanoarchaeia archaeon]|nr:DUF655 domain-containing protein [Candidatus Nanoarchaeia archaeon]